MQTRLNRHSDSLSQTVNNGGLDAHYVALLLGGRFGFVLVAVQCLREVLFFLVLIGVVRVFMFIAQAAAE
jgi:hypothetical protein